MTVAATAKRRRTQARNGYRHMAPLVRPRYRMAGRAALAMLMKRILGMRTAKKKG